MMNLMLYGMAKTRIGELCISDHCRHAPEEMKWLDQCFVSLKCRVPDVRTPSWDLLRLEMPSWEVLSGKYSFH